MNMTSKIINEEALVALEKQNWSKAQNLFFYNARRFPSHETYNNLGFYLITEGLLCKNGKARNALKLGIKYLLKAKNIRASLTNTNAIIKAIEYQLRSKSLGKEQLYRLAVQNLEALHIIDPSPEFKYNKLRFLYLLDPKNDIILSCLKDLVEKAPCHENVSLYFELTRTKKLINAGLDCIRLYETFLSEFELLIFYSKFGFYEDGYYLCNKVYELYGMDEFLASAIIECCINVNRVEEATRYIQQIRELNNMHCLEEDSYNEILGLNKKNSMYRRKKIDNYHYFPPIIDLCGYFGCSIHKTGWECC